MRPESKMLARKGALLALMAAAGLSPFVLAACNGSIGNGATPLDSSTRRGRGADLQAITPSQSFLTVLPDTFVPPLFSGVTGMLRYIFDGDVAGQTNTVPIAGQTNPCGEPLLIATQSVLREGGHRLSDGTTLLADNSRLLTGGAPNPALIAGRYNIDIELQLSGLPTSGPGVHVVPSTASIVPDAAHPAATGTLPAVLTYDVDAPDVEARNLFYWSKVRTPNPPNDPPLGPTEDRPFRSNHIRNGVLQVWLMARTPVQATITAPGASTGERQTFMLFYRRKADGGGPAGSLRGFTNPAGQAPAGVQADDIRVQLPGPNPIPNADGTHSQLPGPIRMVGLQPFSPNADGTAHVRFFLIGGRITDAAVTGGIEVALAPRAAGVDSSGNLLAPTDAPNTQAVLLRTVPAVEDLQPLTQETFLEGVREFGIAITLEPPGETGVDLSLRNPIDVITLRPIRSFDDMNMQCGAPQNAVGPLDSVTPDFPGGITGGSTTGGSTTGGSTTASTGGGASTGGTTTGTTGGGTANGTSTGGGSSRRLH